MSEYLRDNKQLYKILNTIQLFSSLDAEGAITLTDLGSDYMEDWQRLSSSKPLRAPYHSPSRLLALSLALSHALSLLIRSRAPSPWRQ